MEFIDYQEFTAQDFLAANSQHTFSPDMATKPGSTMGDGLVSDKFNPDNSISISEPKLDLSWDSDSQAKPLPNSQDETIDFADGLSPHLQLENENLAFNPLDSYEHNFTGWDSSQKTTDTLMSGDEITRENNNDLAQIDTFAQANLALNQSDSLLKNSGFDQALDGTNWLVGKTGTVRAYDRNVESVARIEQVPGQGRQMYLKLPEEAKINYEDQLSLFQDVSGLQTNKVYEVKARVKWLNPENNLPSAIVSFWAQNPDKSFRGQDFVITDGNGYKNLRFEFTPSQAGTTRFFLGLFTHINGNTDDTEIYVDDYKVTEIGAIPSGQDSRTGNLLSDSAFNRYNAQPTGRNSNTGWSYAVESPVSGLDQSIATINGNRKLRFELPKARNNKDQFNTSVTGVYQNVELVGGQSYELSANFHRRELDRFASHNTSIVQFMLYRQQNNGQELFLGPIDVPLNNNKPLYRSFDLIAPESGNYTVLVRLAGWGNEGNGVVVDVDNVKLKVD